MEYNRIYKVGGVNIPCDIMEWLRVHMPQAIFTMLNKIGLRFNFVTNTISYKVGDLYFYNRNPTGRGLDFAENPDQEEDFLRYAGELHCPKPVQDIAQFPFPELEKMAQGTTILINAVTHTSTQQRRDLDVVMRAAGTTSNWFPHPKAPCLKNQELNNHFKANGVMSPSRIQDPKGTK